MGKQKNVYLNEAFIQLRIDGGNHVDDPVCKAASTTIVISPENKLVLPCYHLGLKDFPIDGNFSIYIIPMRFRNWSHWKGAFLHARAVRSIVICSLHLPSK
ncbi:hypothetical protein PEC18_39610 [Paucibacter sp. O1-1]|nr:hypothetical protein [Paucibacter sp. O1-1]MDA3831718.1 hypothetical protein [Paucibacter sp. O1-1]